MGKFYRKKKKNVFGVTIAILLIAVIAGSVLAYFFNSNFKSKVNNVLNIEETVEESNKETITESEINSQELDKLKQQLEDAEKEIETLDLKLNSANKNNNKLEIEKEELKNKIDNLNFYISFDDEFSFDGSFGNYVTDENTSLSISNNKICVIDDSFFYFDYGKCYKLNLDSKIWESYTFNGTVPTQGSYIWSDGKDYYFSDGASEQYRLNRETNTWEDYFWIGFCPTYGHYVWSDGDSVYYTSRNTTSNVITDNLYKLNKETMTWEEVVFYGIEESGLAGNRIWSDGSNVFFSQVTSSNNYQYKLNKETMTWEETSWNGLNPQGENIWSDGNFIYSSSNLNHFVLDTQSSTWFAFKSEYFESKRIFILDNYVYCFTNTITYFYEIKAR